MAAGAATHAAGPDSAAADRRPEPVPAATVGVRFAAAPPPPAAAPAAATAAQDLAGAAPAAPWPWVLVVVLDRRGAPAPSDGVPPPPPAGTPAPPQGPPPDAPPRAQTAAPPPAPYAEAVLLRARGLDRLLAVLREGPGAPLPATCDFDGALGLLDGGLAQLEYIGDSPELLARRAEFLQARLAEPRPPAPANVRP